MPPRFRGGCVSTPTFNASLYCNSKLVGAKFFLQGYAAGRCATRRSRRAGRPVEDASFFGYAKGTAVGIAPHARIAVYKACSTRWCMDSDLLSAFDEAIADGVDVISISLAAPGPPPGGAPELHSDTIAKASFYAVVRKGIVVSAAAGNSGPRRSTVLNVAPWLVTVAASTIDRRFVANVVLGNGQTIADGLPLLRNGNVLGPGILKPDVTILAAWSGEISPVDFDKDMRAQFNIKSGTEAGFARRASTPFALGAGHVDPNRALDPGLVYDVDTTTDYIAFLCTLGYTPKQIALFTRDAETDCSKQQQQVDFTDLNYPAFAVVFSSYDDKVTQRRRVTNVARFTGGTYTLNITSPHGVRVTVNPPRLHFFRGQRRKRYEVTFEAQGEVPYKHTFGSLVWSDANHTVTSPIAVTWPDRAAGLAAI
ncbi:hypothetical protein PR202_gb03887 [Eleusine coracana subsp. coracana]|uniref:Subtilisin-like protease n=1 Tax=Eleusine coracana subsp. coracana TaxID=191504 RepID=A0AAV5E245_ELECO|nr:hypothetical protein PR202_gb03887 [Eleusine coracana subsp. coracana]